MNEIRMQIRNEPALEQGIQEDGPDPCEIFDVFINIRPPTPFEVGGMMLAGFAAAKVPLLIAEAGLSASGVGFAAGLVGGVAAAAIPTINRETVKSVMKVVAAIGLGIGVGLGIRQQVEPAILAGAGAEIGAKIFASLSLWHNRR